MRKAKSRQGSRTRRTGEWGRCYFRQMAREGLSEVTFALRPEGSEGVHPAEEHSPCANALRKVHVVCPGENREAVWLGQREANNQR